MPLDFSELDQGFIRNNMLRLSDKQIADLIDADPADVHSYINALTGDTGIVTQQMKLDQRKLERPSAIKIPKLKQARVTPPPLMKSRNEL